MQYDFNSNIDKYSALEMLPYETMDMVYGRGWPVIFSAWICSVFSVKMTRDLVLCIANSFDHASWIKLRKQQAEGAVKMLDDKGYLTLINNSKQRHDWKNMPRYMFFEALREVREMALDPTPALRRLINGYR